MKVKLEELNIIFNNAFNDEITLTNEVNMDNCEQWDSFNHLSLIVELEDYYSVKFTQEEIQNLKSVASVIKTLENKHK